MTGPESQGGDDQDLDDRVIHHLSEENRRLKEELELVRTMHSEYLNTKHLNTKLFGVWFSNCKSSLDHFIDQETNYF